MNNIKLPKYTKKDNNSAVLGEIEEGSAIRL